MEGIGSIPSSYHRGVSQEVGTMDPIFKVKLKKKKRMLKHNSEGPLGTLLQTSGEISALVHLITLSLSLGDC